MRGSRGRSALALSAPPFALIFSQRLKPDGFAFSLAIEASCLIRSVGEKILVVINQSPCSKVHHRAQLGLGLETIGIDARKIVEVLDRAPAHHC